MPKKKMAKITSKTFLGEILKIKGAEKILAKYQLPCLFCPMAQYEVKSLRLGDIAKAYNLELEKIIDELNTVKDGS